MVASLIGANARSEVNRLRSWVILQRLIVFQGVADFCASSPIRVVSCRYKPRSYDFRVKPSGFVQTIAPDRQTGANDVFPIAPFETDVRKSMKLQWVDFNTGDPIRLDWHRTGMAGTVGVMRLADYVDQYQEHPEAKAADCDGNPAGPETIGLLGRLRVRSKRLARIGKEVDRLNGDEGATLEPELPVDYERDDLVEDIAYLAAFPQEATARDLGLTARGWRDLIKGRFKPRKATANRIARVAADYRVTFEK